RAEGLNITQHARFSGESEARLLQDRLQLSLAHLPDGVAHLGDLLNLLASLSELLACSRNDLANASNGRRVDDGDACSGWSCSEGRRRDKGGGKERTRFSGEHCGFP